MHIGLTHATFVDAVLHWISFVVLGSSSYCHWQSSAVRVSPSWMLGGTEARFAAHCWENPSLNWPRFAAHCWVELVPRAIALCSRHAHIRARVYHNPSRGSQAGDESDQPNGHQRTRIRSTNTNTRRRRPAFAFKLFSLWLLPHRLYDPCWFIMGAGSFT